MAQKKIIIEPEIHIGDITLVPVAEQTVGYYCSDYGLYFFANKKAVAVIIITQNEKKLVIIPEFSSQFDKLPAEM